MKSMRAMYKNKRTPRPKELLTGEKAHPTLKYAKAL